MKGDQFFMKGSDRTAALEMRRNSLWAKAEVDNTFNTPMPFGVRVGSAHLALESITLVAAGMVVDSKLKAGQQERQRALEFAVDGFKPKEVEMKAAIGSQVPLLKAWTPAADMQRRCKELGAPTYRSKDTMWQRLVEYQTRRQEGERARLLEVQAAGVQGHHGLRRAEGHDGPDAPSEEERRLH